MKSFHLATVISCIVIALAPATQASKLTNWINNHAVPRAPSANKINGAADSANAAAKSADAAAQETASTMKETRSVMQQIQLPLTIAAWFLPIWLFCLTINSLKSIAYRSVQPLASSVSAATPLSESVHFRRRRFRMVLSIIVGTLVGLLAPFVLASAVHPAASSEGVYEIGDAMLLVSVIASNLVMWLVLVPRRFQPS